MILACSEPSARISLSNAMSQLGHADLNLNSLLVLRRPTHHACSELSAGTSLSNAMYLHGPANPNLNSLLVLRRPTHHACSELSARTSLLNAMSLHGPANLNLNSVLVHRTRTPSLACLGHFVLKVTSVMYQTGNATQLKRQVVIAVTTQRSLATPPTHHASLEPSALTSLSSVISQLGLVDLSKNQPPITTPRRATTPT
jgi:hypothetical protein